MALADQKPEHFDYRGEVSDFNKKLKAKINDKNNEVSGHIENIRQRVPELMGNSLLDRYLITDSQGQHKDRRSEARDEAIDADFEEVTQGVPANKASDDDDYTFDASAFVGNSF
jgi:hypothetical protein